MSCGSSVATRSMSASLVVRPSERRSEPRASDGGIAHGAQHVGRLARPGRARGAGGGGHTLEVEGHDEVIAEDAAHDDREMAGQPLAGVARELDVVDGQQRQAQAVAPRLQQRRRWRPAPPTPARRRRPCPALPPRSRCRHAGSVPGCHRASGAGWRCHDGSRAPRLRPARRPCGAANETRSAPRAATSMASCPTAWTASTWTSAAAPSRARAMSSPSGWIVPDLVVGQLEADEDGPLGQRRGQLVRDRRDRSGRRAA